MFRIHVATAAAILSAFASGVAGQAAAQSCQATCNTAHDQCTEAGRDDTACLNAWHQCHVGCNTPKAGATKLKVSQPSPNTVVIKSVPAKKK